MSTMKRPTEQALRKYTDAQLFTLILQAERGVTVGKIQFTDGCLLGSLFREEDRRAKFDPRWARIKAAAVADEDWPADDVASFQNH